MVDVRIRDWTKTTTVLTPFFCGHFRFNPISLLEVTDLPNLTPLYLCDLHLGTAASVAQHADPQRNPITVIPLNGCCCCCIRSGTRGQRTHLCWDAEGTEWYFLWVLKKENMVRKMFWWNTKTYQKNYNNWLISTLYFVIVWPLVPQTRGWSIVLLSRDDGYCNC